MSGVPVAVEAFPGNTGDPNTVGPVLERITQGIGLRRLVQAAEAKLEAVRRATARLRGKARIGVRVGKVLGA